MFELAFAAHIPVIGVVTDDIVNFEAVLHTLTGLKPTQLTATTHATKLQPVIYWTDNLDHVTTKLYDKLLEGEHQLIVINPATPSLLVFDAGVLPTPEPLVRQYLNDALGNPPPERMNEMLHIVKGMSLKAIGETVMLTQARTGGTLPAEVRRTRTMLNGGIQGLLTMDTSIDFYEFPMKLAEWLKINAPYFHDPLTPQKLVPRGMLMVGDAGVGKSMGAKAIANHLNVPLFRLDLAGAMNRYIGETENRVMRSLQLIERESPCVLMIDEVEKVINGKDESGVTDRILSQLLWWMAEHSSRIVTVLTTNDLQLIPPELYREGRIDMVLRIPKLSLAEANKFAARVFNSVMGHPPKAHHSLKINQALKTGDQMEFAHAKVATMVYGLVKQHHWLSPASATDCK
jgi:hypothetical protein